MNFKISFKEKINITDDVKGSVENVVRLLFKKAAISRSPRKRGGRKDPYLSAADGQFLGVLVPKRDHPESIFNEYGIYGSHLSEFSIFNETGIYGSENSMYSPFNELTVIPPKILCAGKEIGSLTKNDHIEKAVDPDELFKVLQKTKKVNWKKIFGKLLD